MNISQGIDNNESFIPSISTEGIIKLKDSNLTEDLNKKLRYWIKTMHKLKQQIHIDTKQLLKEIKTGCFSLIKNINETINNLTEILNKKNLQEEDPNQYLNILTSNLSTRTLDLNLLSNIKTLYSQTCFRFQPISSIQDESKIEKYKTLEIQKTELISSQIINQSILEKWKLRKNEHESQVLKLLKNPDEKTLKKIRDEVNLINRFQETRIFCKILEYDDGKNYGYYYENITTLDTLLGKKIFTVEEVLRFLSFVAGFMNVVIGQLYNTFIEPSIIGYQDNEFKMIDFYYDVDTMNKNYLPPETNTQEQKIRQSLSFVYTAGLIVMEMLGENTIGFNNPNLFSLILLKIDNLKVPDQLKTLLKKMLEPYKNERITRGEFFEELRKIQKIIS